MPSARPVSAEIRDFTFQVDACNNSGGTLFCKIKVTNRADTERPIIFFLDTMALDDLGNRFRLRNIQIGSRGNRGDRDNYREFAPDTETPIVLFFEDTSPKIRWIRSLKIIMGIGATAAGGSNSTINLRNIPVISE
jgi:hypothetical protein